MNTFRVLLTALTLLMAMSAFASTEGVAEPVNLDHALVTDAAVVDETAVAGDGFPWVSLNQTRAPELSLEYDCASAGCLMFYGCMMDGSCQPDAGACRYETGPPPCECRQTECW